MAPLLDGRKSTGYILGKAGKRGAFLEQAGNPGSGCALLSITYSPAWYSLLAEAEYINMLREPNSVRSMPHKLRHLHQLRKLNKNQTEGKAKVVAAGWGIELI